MFLSKGDNSDSQFLDVTVSGFLVVVGKRTRNLIKIRSFALLQHLCIKIWSHLHRTERSLSRFRNLISTRENKYPIHSNVGVDAMTPTGWIKNLQQNTSHYLHIQIFPVTFIFKNVICDMLVWICSLQPWT